MVVNGKSNIRTCTTYLEEGMVVETQEDRGNLPRNKMVGQVVEMPKGEPDDV